MRKISKSLRIKILLAVLCFVIGGWNVQVINAQTKPLIYPDIITALNTKLPNQFFKNKNALINWLINQIKERKVEKGLSKEMEGTLRQIGANDGFIRIIKENSPSIPVLDNLKAFKNSMGMEFVLIPGGTFFMGSDPTGGENDREEEFPRHLVTISKAFYISKFEITQEQWEKITGNNPSHFNNCSRCPVEQVSWNDIQDFIRILNEKGEGKYRLPTEAEWEYAARAGTNTRFAFGENLSTSQANFLSEDEDSDKGKTVPVGSFQPNNWGLFDMHGNVNEWVQDWEGQYSKLANIDPTGPTTGTERLIRGGGWAVSDYCLTSTIRYSDVPSYRNNTVGFRLVREER